MTTHAAPLPMLSKPIQKRSPRIVRAASADSFLPCTAPATEMTPFGFTLATKHSTMLAEHRASKSPTRSIMHRIMSPTSSYLSSLESLVCQDPDDELRTIPDDDEMINIDNIMIPPKSPICVALPQEESGLMTILDKDRPLPTKAPSAVPSTASSEQDPTSQPRTRISTPHPPGTPPRPPSSCGRKMTWAQDEEDLESLLAAAMQQLGERRVVEKKPRPIRRSKSEGANPWHVERERQQQQLPVRGKGLFLGPRHAPVRRLSRMPATVCQLPCAVCWGADKASPAGEPSRARPSTAHTSDPRPLEEIMYGMSLACDEQPVAEWVCSCPDGEEGEERMVVRWVFP